eukprot:SAG31_NODE_1000_length_10456_cov_3.588394_4_plen_587_part_00
MRFSQIDVGQAECVVRKEVHNHVSQGFAAAFDGANPDGCLAVPEVGKELPEDKYGFLVSEGGYRAYKQKSPFGDIEPLLQAIGLSPMELAGDVLDAAMIQKLHTQSEEALEMLEIFKAKVDAAKERWLKGTKKVTGAQALLDKAKGNEQKLSKIEVPVTKFVQAGISELFHEKLQPILEDSEDPVITKRLRKLRPLLETAKRTADMRRGLDQLLQEFALQKTKEHVFPELQQRIASMPSLPDIPGAAQSTKDIVMKKIGLIIFDLAESNLRKHVHAQVMTVYALVTSAAAEPGCKVMLDPGQELKEDNCGFLINEGGYRKFRGSPFVSLVQRPPSPERLVAKVMDEETIKKLHTQAELVQDFIIMYAEQAKTAKEIWLQDGGGQAQIDAARAKGKLKKVKIPVMEFQQVGLQFCMQQLEQILDEIGLEVAERLEDVKERFEKSDRSTDMRRHFGQLLQELVVSKAKRNVFPELKSKIARQPGIGGFPLPTEVVDIAATLTFNVAEAEVRRVVHAKFHEEFNTVALSLVPHGCGILKESGQEAKEDEYGFLIKTGGYKKFAEKKLRCDAVSILFSPGRLLLGVFTSR